MHIFGIRTPIVKLGDHLSSVAIRALTAPEKASGLNLEGKILAVTSKIVSLCENQNISRNQIAKADLIRREADIDLGEIGYGTHLTVKENLLLASAGIDESNSENGDFLCLPKNPEASAKQLWRSLRDHFQLRNFGIIVTDSRTAPLRLGTTGVSLSHWGFKGLIDRVGSPDLFGRPLQMTKVNVVDALAASAVLLMGEGAEQTPLALISDLPPGLVSFVDSTDMNELRVPQEGSEFPSDLYWPFLAPGFRRN